MRDLTGEKFCRWTVIGPYAENPKGERKWLCRCECGTEKYVLERSLLYGGSESCGCLRKERAARAVAYDLHGQVFGELTVLDVAEDVSEATLDKIRAVEGVIRVRKI